MPAMKAIHDVLALERQTTLVRLATLTDDFDKLLAASEGSNADDEHDPEGATIAYERSQLDAFAQQARAHLAAIDAALTRLAEGTYGTCEVCERSIPAERLRARPTAMSCVACAPS
jgi:DnaK suppressor protein